MQEKGHSKNVSWVATTIKCYTNEVIVHLCIDG